MSEKSFAFFDFDDTLCQGDSVLYWMAYCQSRRPWLRLFLPITWVALLLFALRIVKGDDLKRFYLLPLCYISEKDIQHWTIDFTRRILAPRLYPQMLLRFEAHRQLGHRTIVISASASFYIQAMRPWLPAEVLIGSELIFPKSGLFRLPRYTHRNLKREQKVFHLRELFALGKQVKGAYAYSDHFSDRFLLEFVEHALAVQPDRALEKLAKQKSWPILLPHSKVLWKTKIEKLCLLLFGSYGPWPVEIPAPRVRSREEEKRILENECRQIDAL